jgi:beta-mannosidase
MHKYFSFPEVTIDAEVKKNKDGLAIVLKADNFAKTVGIQFERDDLVLSDNYFDILPGETRTVIVEEIVGDKLLTIEDLQTQIKIKAVNTINY